MKQFEYTIHDPLGIHARPAGMLVKEAKAFADTVVTITKNGTTVKATQLMKLMSLGVKKGDVVTVAADGADEDAAIIAISNFFQNKAGIWIGICGELGADISMLPTFLAIGIDELSVSPAAVLPVRAAIRQSIAQTCTLEMLEC